jgi:hypothetical protein
MSQPPGFIDTNFTSHVCKLQKAIYGLKQAPRAWYHELHSFLLQSGFTNSYADTSLFVLITGKHLVYLLVYVDDLIITGDDAHMVNQSAGSSVLSERSWKVVIFSWDRNSSKPAWISAISTSVSA